MMQPLLSDEVAEALADVTLDAPARGIREVAGPEAAPLADFVARWLRKPETTLAALPPTTALAWRPRWRERNPCLCAGGRCLVVEHLT